MKKIQPANFAEPPGHYSPAVVHNGLVFVSGQLSIDPDRDAAWPTTVVIIKSRPVSEQEAITAGIVLKPPIFAERNSLGAPKPIVSADPAPINKKATDTQQIVRRSVISRKSRVKKVRANRRRTSSKSWMDKVWDLHN